MKCQYGFKFTGMFRENWLSKIYKSPSKCRTYFSLFFLRIHDLCLIMQKRISIFEAFAFVSGNHGLVFLYLPIIIK